MEIKIGIADVAREVSLESHESPEDITAKLEQALAANSLLELIDTKGRRVIVPAHRVAYLDLGSSTARAVGFGAV